MSRLLSGLWSAVRDIAHANHRSGLEVEERHVSDNREALLVPQEREGTVCVTRVAKLGTYERLLRRNRTNRPEEIITDKESIVAGAVGTYQRLPLAPRQAGEGRKRRASVQI